MTDRRKNPFPVDRFMGRDDEVASVVSLVNSTQSAAIIGEPRSGKTSLLRHLSGDLANVSAPDEYEAAKLFLEKLCAAFQLSPAQVIPVPGNHDLNWGLSVDAYHPVRRSKLEAPPAEGTFIAGSGDLLELRDEALYLQRFAHFATFYQAVRGEPYPLEPANQALLYALPAQHILILGLNSAWELDHHYQTRAGIHAIALSRALELVHAEPTYRDFLKIAVWHHPVQSAFEDCIKDHDFLERLAAADFRLGLHGHIHEAQNHVYRYDRSAGGRRVEIVCAGTFGAPVREWVAGYPLQYQLLRFQGESVTVETPKVDVRAAVFRDGKVLLVREQTVRAPAR